MEEKKPLSYVENRMSKPYPTEIGAPKFEPTNISIFKQVIYLLNLNMGFMLM